MTRTQQRRQRLLKQANLLEQQLVYIYDQIKDIDEVEGKKFKRQNCFEKAENLWLHSRYQRQ